MDATLTDPSTLYLQMLIAGDNMTAQITNEDASAGLNSGLNNSVYVLPPRQVKLTVACVSGVTKPAEE